MPLDSSTHFALVFPGRQDRREGVLLPEVILAHLAVSRGDSPPQGCGGCMADGLSSRWAMESEGASLELAEGVMRSAARCI